MRRDEVDSMSMRKNIDEALVDRIMALHYNKVTLTNIASEVEMPVSTISVIVRTSKALGKTIIG